MTTSEHPAVLEWLTLLRVAATAAVVFGHSASAFNAFGFTQWPNMPYMQSIAVTVFFAVSGFTIAWVADSSRNDFARYSYNRFMRLAIPLIPILLLEWSIEAVVLGDAHPYPENTSWLTLIGNAAFLQNVGGIGIGPYGLNRPLWTISLEFWTYIAFGGLYYAAARRTLVPLIVAALAGWFLWPYVIGSGRGAGLPLVWSGGAGLYFLLKKVRPPGWSLPILVLATALSLRLLTVPALWPSGGEYSRLYNAILFLTFALGMSAATVAGNSVLPKLFLHWMSSFAYTAYLSHYLIILLMKAPLGLPDGPLSAVTAAAVACLVAWALSLCFERHYKIVRDRVWQISRSLRGRPSRRGPIFRD